MRNGSSARSILILLVLFLGTAFVALYPGVSPVSGQDDKDDGAPWTPPGTPEPEPPRALQLKCEPQFVSVGDSFSLYARYLSSGETTGISLGQRTDLYMRLTSEAKNMNLYITYDAFGNLYFTDDVVPFMNSWVTVPFDWVDAFQVAVPNDNYYLGFYQFKAQLVLTGETPAASTEISEAHITVTELDSTSGN